MEYKIGVIGLGYVGLPLAVAFAERYRVVGYDIDEVRVQTIRTGEDTTNEVNSLELSSVLSSISPKCGLTVSHQSESLRNCSIYIVAVPTLTNSKNRLDIEPLKKASKIVGSVLSKGDIVIYESTVYPGVTEEQCVPILENISELTYNVDFFVGYSPERINPGDKHHVFSNICKVVSGSTENTLCVVDALYSSVLSADTFRVSSIRVAEAVKVVENTQRDVNIAFMNEIARIFSLMQIDTSEVLNAAKTKWNFLPFQPGLVGGHCIGIDPYYLIQKAEDLGYYPELILAGRKVNEAMGEHVAAQLLKLMVKKEISTVGAKVLVLGLTFKENCPDVRNSKIPSILSELSDYGLLVDVYDPWVKQGGVKPDVNFTVIEDPKRGEYNAVLLAVAHREFVQMDVRTFLKPNGVVYDVKSILPKELVDGRL